ncbi:MAG: spore maturation protein [Lachnospiraceae bacterium]|nr:spore maturation protein [Lachnospiraceae bacterium]
MNVLSHISDIIIPVLLFYIVGYGLISKVKVYEAFLTGAREGLKVVVDIMPTLVGLLVAVGVLRASGFLEFLSGLLAPLAEPAGIPAAVVPVILVKLFSGSAATGLVLDVFRTYGPDSYTGMLVSILMSCTETCFYTMSMYYLAAKVTKTRYTLKGALLSTLAGTVASVVLAKWMV